MQIYEIICGAIVLLLCLLIIILCLMQDEKTQQNMTSALGGGSNDSFYAQNEGNTRDAALAKLTKILGIIWKEHRQILILFGTILDNRYQ